MRKNNSSNLIQIQQDFIQKNITVFTPLIFSRLVNKNAIQTKLLLRAGVNKNVFTRIKRGVYYLNALSPSAFELANVLYAPSYISLETALSYYRIIPEVTYTITSLSTKTPRVFKKNNREFAYRKINKELFFGYSKINIGNKTIIIAEKEKALLDYFYFVAINLKRVTDRFDFKKIDRNKIENHLPYFRKTMQGRKLVAFNNLVNKYL